MMLLEMMSSLSGKATSSPSFIATMMVGSKGCWMAAVVYFLATMWKRMMILKLNIVLVLNLKHCVAVVCNLAQSTTTTLTTNQSTALMVKHAQVGEGHGHSILITSSNDDVILLAASRLGHKFDTMLGGLQQQH
jgi:hypothetical protein